jgi:hypothetical protein
VGGGSQPRRIRAATGSSVVEALEDYRRSYRAILFDIAEDATCFEAFEGEVKAFVGAGTGTLERDWQQAVENLRAGRLSADWLRRSSADLPPTITVAKLEEPSAANNQVEEGASVAA